MALLAVHGLVGLALFPTGSRLGRRAFLVAALAPLATLAWLAHPDAGHRRRRHRHRARLVGRPARPRRRPAPRRVRRADGAARRRHRPRRVRLLRGVLLPVERVDIGRTAGLLTLFAGAMLCVVLADNLFLLYTGWELTSITSYLLIGNDHTKTHARAAALHALLVTSFGGLAMLAGFILIGQQAGTYRLSAAARLSAARHHGRRRPRAHPPRRVHEVGAVPVPLVAAGGDGGADTRQRLPPLGHDGEGRRVPRRPVRAGVRHHGGSGGRSCSPSAPPRWCSAVCARCASTTSSCCSPTAR